MPPDASHQHDSRRRLFPLWKRSAAAATTVSPRRRGGEPPARPARPDVFVPVGLGGFSLLAGGFGGLFCAAVGPGIWELLSGRPLFGPEASEEAFAATRAAARDCLAIGSLDSLGGWMAQMCLIVAAVTAIVVHATLRQRPQRGRAGGWSFLAGLWLATACAGEVPLDRLVASLATDVTGFRFGPEGAGWWGAIAAMLFGTAATWSVLCLRERLAPILWLGGCLAAWLVAAAAPWTAMDRRLGNVCWMAGATLAAIAMFAAARSALREVRGLSAPRREAVTARDRPAAGAPRHDNNAASGRAGGSDPARGGTEPECAAPSDPREETVYIDGSEADHDVSGRRLSKAERRRLRKLAQLNRAA